MTFKWTNFKILKILSNLYEPNMFLDKNLIFQLLDPGQISHFNPPFQTFSIISNLEKEGEGEQKKRQKRGGKGQVKTKKKETGPKGISLSRASRGKKKFVTVVTGLATYGKHSTVAICIYTG